MEMFYATLRDFPRRVANRVQTIKMAEALSRRFSLTMSVSKLHLGVEELFAYYGVTSPFCIVELGDTRVRPITLWRFPQLLKAIKKVNPDFIFVREEYPALLLSFFFNNLIYEMHDFMLEREWLYSRIIKNSLITIVITRHLQQRCVESIGASKNLIMLPDGVDLNNFGGQIDSNEAKKALRLPLDKKVVLYSGRLSRWKGIYTLIESANFLPPEFQIVIIGGFEGEGETVRRIIRSSGLSKKIQLLGFRPHTEVPQFVQAADVLVLPNSAKNDISRYFTSPLKMFEYMASGRPIVASDIPSIREVLDEETAVLFPPDNPKALAEAIVAAGADSAAVRTKIDNCLNKVREYSWDSRANKLVTLLEQRMTSPMRPMS